MHAVQALLQGVLAMSFQTVRMRDSVLCKQCNCVSIAFKSQPVRQHLHERCQSTLQRWHVAQRLRRQKSANTMQVKSAKHGLQVSLSDALSPVTALLDGRIDGAPV